MADAGANYFDLNVERVLEHWTVAHAVRELLANALDEHLLGHGDVPTVTASGGSWTIRDHGRGLRHEHFTQNENDEKTTSEAVIGRFGVGLKDALAVLDRHGIGVRIRTATADVTTEVHAKAGFPDTSTLHAVFRPPSEPSLVGTEVVLEGVADDDVAVAKRFFRRWSDEVVFDETPYGDLLARSPDPDEAARIYVRGVRVAEEETFLFSYDVTRFNAKLARALNRERSNVGRAAYGDRVKDILLAARSPAAMEALIADLGEFQSGGQHTESSWVDVALHASRVVSATGEVVFVTPSQLATGGPLFDYVREEGRRLLVVPGKVMDRLAGEHDVDGQPIRTLDVFAREWQQSFRFDLVDPAALSEGERAVLARVPDVFTLLGLAPDQWPVVVSRTMRPGARGVGAAGVWDGRRTIVQRGELRSLRRFCATLLHEIAHARTGTDDATLEFEAALTDQLGVLGESSLT